MTYLTLSVLNINISSPLFSFGGNKRIETEKLFAVSVTPGDSILVHRTELFVAEVGLRG